MVIPSHQPTYPIPLFLHCCLAIPIALQIVLQARKPPKLHKARLTSYTKSTIYNSAVSYDGRNWGEMAGGDVVKGVVYMIENKAQENLVKAYVGEPCVPKEDEIEILPKSVFGRKEKIRVRCLCVRSGKCDERGRLPLKVSSHTAPF